MDPRKEKTRQTLLAAMVDVLKTENFNSITTSELAKKAGVSRSGFYTHYKDKYEMVESYQKDFFLSLEDVFTQTTGNRYAALLGVFELLYREELLSALLTPNGTQEIQAFIISKIKQFISTDLITALQLENLTPMQIEYSSVYLSHAIFGICQSWIMNGKNESPEEMADFLMKLLPQ